MDVGGWLRSLGLDQYEVNFRENKIDADVLPRLTADDLKDIGVSAVGDRRRLLDAIATLAGAIPTEASRRAPQSAPPKNPQLAAGALTFRQPVDMFAQAAIIGPQTILAPSSSCRVQSVSHQNGVIKVSADCNDTISYTTQTVQITVRSTNEIVYSPAGDPALDTTLIKCAM